MESLWLALYWGSPIGLGIFLVCLGGMVYLWTKADVERKRAGLTKEKKEKKE